MTLVSQLKRWRLSGTTPTRTIGELQLRKNGTALDIWIRVNSRPRWFAIQASDLEDFLQNSDIERTFQAESDGNAE